MKRILIAKCPICNEDLTITKLHCDNCNVEINGEFALNRFCYLSKEQLKFVELFLKNQGNIKGVEKEMNISYPTVKKILSEVLSCLGYTDTNELSITRQEVMDRLNNNEISLDEASELLKGLKQ